MHGIQNALAAVNMAITVVRKRDSQAKKAAKESGLFHLLVRRSIPIPPVILLLIILIVWCSSTLFSISVFYVCVSSRKLNLHCVTAGTRPDLPGILSKNNYAEKSTATTATNASDAGKYEYASTKEIDFATIKDVGDKESASTTTDTITTIHPDEVDKKKITYVVDRSIS